MLKTAPWFAYVCLWFAAGSTLSASTPEAQGVDAQGKLDLDAPVVSYFPEYQIASPSTLGCK